MTQDEAKAILQACTAHPEQAQGERVSQALAMMESDPELAKWFEQEMAFDNEFRASFNELEPPPGLKERVLASAPASGNTPIPFPGQSRAWWQNPKLISLAACLLLFFTFGALLFDPQQLQAEPDIPDFYEDIAATSKQFASENHAALEKKHDDLDTLRDFLADRGAPVPGMLPPKVDALREVGASKIQWRNSPVAVVAMGSQHTYNLFVIDMAVFGDDDTPPASTEVHQLDEVCLLTWSQDGHLYTLTIVGPPELVRALL